MLFRFSLYGFLKNQRYYEAFLYLAFLDKGLDFFQIGLLVAARQLAVNVVEVPSGAIADVCGRRRSMVVAFASYIAGFLVLGGTNGLPLLAAGMVLLGIGDSFRSGTHKAMIFAWLQEQGREGERVRVYGYTRSWSQFGSAVSVVAGAAIVLLADDYAWIFHAAVIPYVAGIVNILGYPRSLEGEAAGRPSIAAVVRHMVATLRTALRERGLRRLVLEAMGFDGVFAAVKDYLQPALEAVAVALAASAVLGGDLSDTRRTALLVGAVYVVLYVLSGMASRSAHSVAVAAGGERRAARLLWVVAAAIYAGLLLAGAAGALVGVVLAFACLHVLQNVWRPILVSRFDAHGDASQGASLLSIESQARRLATIVVAPLLGLLVDTTAAGGAGAAATEAVLGARHFCPIGAVGLAVAAAILLTGGGPRGGVRGTAETNHGSAAREE